ncbi:unnamed protein product, partial [Mesorhabditis belari]|uniref:RING-type E3 ubiquitin transferase n=1 Tax=Mesorhabditis belari TaxID=2138241 RepID=A0AAF3EC08_9BILA
MPQNAELSQTPGHCLYYHYLGKCIRGYRCRYQHDPSFNPNPKPPCSIKGCEQIEQGARYGLLECNHVVCLSDIINFRHHQAHPEDGEEKHKFRSCPFCTRPTRFVVPTRVWPKNHHQKEKIMMLYLKYCSTIRCRYYKVDDKGHGHGCPYGGKVCLFKHEKSDGSFDREDPPERNSRQSPNEHRDLPENDQDQPSYTDDFEYLHHLPNLDLQLTLDYLKASNPALNLDEDIETLSFFPLINFISIFDRISAEPYSPDETMGHGYFNDSAFVHQANEK